MSKEQLEEIKESFADLEKVKIHILKGKILDGLDEFKKNKRQQWTELRFEKPLLVKLLSSIEQAERVEELEDILDQDHRQEVLEGLYDQNERYRKALGKAFNVLGKHVCEKDHKDVDAYEIIIKALEESE